jgi:hypothetical protein
VEKPYHRHSRLLRTRSEWAHDHYPTKKRNELSPLHSIYLVGTGEKRRIAMNSRRLTRPSSTVTEPEYQMSG